MPDEVIARSYVELLPRNAQNFGRQVAGNVKQTMGQATQAVRQQVDQAVQGARRQTQQVTAEARKQTQAQVGSARQTARQVGQVNQRLRDENGRYVKQTEDQHRKANDRIRRDSTRTTATIGKSFGGLRASIGKSFSGLGGVIAAGVGGLAVGGFIKSAITAASDLNETVSKTGVIFGQDALPALQAFARTADKSLGQSRQQALDAAATFGIFGKSAGLSGQQLVGFSTELTTLASDMASFSNTSPEEAITAIGAALRGETEPIRRYGVLIDDASTRNEALRLGIVKTTKEALTPQQRVLAVQSLIMKQTSAAQGDFARTSGGLANQQRILAAQFTNAKASLGEVFLPAALTLVGFLNTKAIPAFREFAGGIRAFAAAFRAGDGDITSSGFPGFMERLAFHARTAFDYFRTNVLPILREFGSYLVGTVVPAVARFASNLAQTLWPIISTVFNFVATQVIPRLREFGGQLQPIIQRGAQMADALARNREILVPFVSTLLAGYAAFKLWLIIQTVIKFVRAWASAQAILNLVLTANPVGLVIVAVAALVTGLIFAYRHSDRFREVLQKAWAGIKAAATAAWPVIKAAVDVVVAAFQLWWKVVGTFVLPRLISMLKVVWTTAQIMARIIIGAFNALKSPVISVLTFLTRIFLDWVGNMVNGAAKALGWVPGVGGKLKRAAAAFNTFKDQTNSALAKLKDQTINVTPNLRNVTFQGRTVPLNNIGSFGRLASGGPVHGPGTTTSDSVPTLLSNQEHVLSAREVTGMGGHGKVAQMRAAARSGRFGFAAGGTTAVNIRSAFPSPNGTGRWAGGLNNAVLSAVGPIARTMASTVAQQLVTAGGLFSRGLVGVLQFVKSQVGKPYLWGGVGPRGYDCSGLVSAAINVALGRNPYRRLGATGSMPWSMFKSGPSAFQVGWFKGNPGHTAATVNGVNIESRGGRGVVMGRAARGARDRLFTNIAGIRGFARGGHLGDPAFDYVSPRGKAFVGRNALRMLLGGYQTGAWRILRDQLALVHRGEMVVPENQAEALRTLFTGSGRTEAPPRPGPGPGPSDGYVRLHPDDLRALAALLASMPIVLNGKRLDEGVTNEAINRRR